jgi:hypothetical protein
MKSWQALSCNCKSNMTSIGVYDACTLMDRIKTFLGDLLRPAEAPSSFDALLGEDRNGREEIVSIPPEDPYNLVYWVSCLEQPTHCQTQPLLICIYRSLFYKERPCCFHGTVRSDVLTGRDQDRIPLTRLTL